MFNFLKRHVTPEKRDFYRACNVYCNPTKDLAIVASVYNHGGLLAEKLGGATILSLSNSEELNKAVQASLACCEYEANFNYSDRKPSDWPAFQVSQYKTIKEFEIDFIRLLVKGVNDKNLFYEIQSQSFGDYGIQLTATINAISEDYGNAIQYVIKEFQACASVVNDS